MILEIKKRGDELFGLNRGKGFIYKPMKLGSPRHERREKTFAEREERLFK